MIPVEDNLAAYSNAKDGKLTLMPTPTLSLRLRPGRIFVMLLADPVGRKIQTSRHLRQGFLGRVKYSKLLKNGQ